MLLFPLVVWAGMSFQPNAAWAQQMMQTKLSVADAYITESRADTAHDALCLARGLGNPRAAHFRDQKFRQALDDFQRTHGGQDYPLKPCPPSPPSAAVE